MIESSVEWNQHYSLMHVQVLHLKFKTFKTVTVVEGYSKRQIAVLSSEKCIVIIFRIPMCYHKIWRYDTIQINMLKHVAVHWSSILTNNIH